MNRVKIVLKNSAFSIATQLILILAGFYSQRALNFAFGSALIGVNSVISNIISILSVSELGISTAIVFHLYRAVAEEDEALIRALMAIYRRFYLWIAGCIFGAGLFLLPFVHLFMNENPFPISYIRTLFFLWLVRTALSYPLGYRRSILVANQKDYVCSILTLSTNLFYYLSTIVFVRFFQEFAFALGCSILFEILVALLQNRYIARLYPFLGGFQKLGADRSLLSSIRSDVKNIFLSRLAQKLLNSTDNLILSGMISVILTGTYGNYCLITQSVTNLVLGLNNAVIPTLGNLFVEGDVKKEYRILQQMTLVYFLLAAFVSCSLFALLNPFVGDLWLTRDYLLPLSVVACSSLCCGIQILGFPLGCWMSVNGMFREDRNLTIAAAAINLVLSLALVRPLGLIGIILGTVCAYFTMAICRIVFFFRGTLRTSPARYAADLAMYLGLLITETLLCGWCSRVLYRGTLLSFVLCGCICILLPNGINLLLFCRTERFRNLYSLFASLYHHAK